MNAWTLDPRAFVADKLPRMQKLPQRVESRSLALLQAFEDDPARLLSPALLLTASLPVALLIGVPSAGAGIGIALGGLGSAAAALYMRRRVRENDDRLARAIADIHADADRRVELVTRQYEWAVNDVANLRDALRRARAQLAARDEATPAQPVISRRLADTDPLTTLRFATEQVAAEQVRVLNNGIVVAISARALEPGTDSVFVVRVSEYVAAALRAETHGYRIEALVGEQWRTLAMRTAGEADLPATQVRDKRGRVFRASTEDAPHAILTFPVPAES